MPTIALSGNDTISINNRIINDLADGNCVELTFPNDIAQVKTGKNGNTIYGFNTTGQQCEAKMRVIRGGADDKYLNNLIIQQNLNFQSTVLNFGQFIKKIGDGQGNVTNDTYVMGGGVFVKQVAAQSNVEGETNQSVSEYMIRFSNAPRAIG